MIFEGKALQVDRLPGGNARVDFPMTNLDLQVLVRNEGFISDAVPQ